MRRNLNFLAGTFTSSMVGDGIFSKESGHAIDELNGKELYCGINNNGLKGTLKEMGFNIKPLSSKDGKFTAVEGDTIYCIHPSTKIYEYKDSARLPQDITLTLDIVKVISVH